jgi:photosystem II stability/assembly factor-like uncharacterized protein
MKPRSLLLAVVLVACGTSKSSATPGAQDAGGDDAQGDDAGNPADAGETYAQAVTAAAWKAVSGAPTAPKGAKMDDIFFPSASVGYAVSGAASTVYKSTDGGATWSVAFTHAGTYFRSLDFLDEMHGFASNLGAGLSPSITDTNVLYETKDGGQTWNPVTSITGPMPSGICNQNDIDGTHLVAVGRVEGPPFFMKSSDAGATWTSTSLSSQLSMLIDARFTTPLDGIVIGSTPGNITTGSPPFYCTVLHTADGGQSWQTAFTSKTSDSLCWKISFPSPNVGYVSVQDAGGSGPPSFLKTTDGGQTWTEMPLPSNSSGSYLGIGVGFITEDIGWVSADFASTTAAPEPTYRTIDGGKTWTPDSALKSPINRFRFLTPTTAFAIGGTIWKLDVNWTGGET